METKQVTLNKVEHAEYNGKEYRKIVTDQGTFNIKDGKGGSLRNQWGLLDQCIGKVITLNMGDFEGKPFVASMILPIPGAREPQQPIQDMQGKINHTEDNRVRSMAVSYSKDLVVAGQIQLADLYNQAHDIEEYLNNKFNPEYKPDWLMKYLK
jgi:hypothetical protein